MPQIEEIAQALPPELVDEVTRWAESVQASGVLVPRPAADKLAKLVACSEFAATVLQREWHWFTTNLLLFDGPIAAAELRGFGDELSRSSGDMAATKAGFRRFRNRSMLRILWRDIHGLADLDETLQQLSALADAMLKAAAEIAAAQMQERFGSVISAEGNSVEFITLGMGKLGGRELNFSSDIDVIFCYSEDGDSDGLRKLSAHEYFGRFSRIIIDLLDDKTSDGFVYRVDTRLRPFGASGPPVVSLAALESYLVQHGRDWERYAYVKARVVGVQPNDDTLRDLQDNIIRPFVYRRYIDFGVFESLRDMHAMISTEVRRQELQDNVKLGPGGIREAEFIVQALQLVRGGADSSLQDARLQSVVPHVVAASGLSNDDAQVLVAGYRYLRRLENFIQAIRDQQTHDLPGSAVDRARICLAMGYDSWSTLIAATERHRGQISRLFTELGLKSVEGEPQHVEQFDRLWESSAETGAWRVALSDSPSQETDRLAEIISEFSARPATQQISKIAGQRLQRLIPSLLAKVADSQRPVAALQRSLLIIEKVLRRSAYLALLNENQTALSRLVELCARSQYITDQIARHPVLLDELLDPRSFAGGVSKSEIHDEMRQRLSQETDDDSESRMQVIAQHQRATLFRIAVADFNGDLPTMKVSDALTWLAEAVLDETLKQAWDDLTAIHGIPQYVVGGKSFDAGFGIVGYGKLGGLELSYGSDLDVVFLHNSQGDEQRTNGSKPIENAVFFPRLVRRLVHFLTTQTSSGVLYDIDTRLRPDGKSGLLVSNTIAYERYQEENAWTWEHQALLRSRAVAGDEVLLQDFERIRTETLTKRVDVTNLRSDVTQMRQRMRENLDKSSEQQFDLKNGRGGIGDLEFLVQYRVLCEANHRPEVVRYSDNVRQLDELVAGGFVVASIGRELQQIYRAFRARSHHLGLDGKPAIVAVDEFVAERKRVGQLWDEWLT